MPTPLERICGITGYKHELLEKYLAEKDGKIEVHCNYCNTDYVFFRDDFEKKE